MIYKANIINESGEIRQFYITADSEGEAIRRARDTYAVPVDRIILLEYYEDVPGDQMAVGKKHIIGEKKSKRDQKKSDKATELFYRAIKKRGKKKQAYIEKYNFVETQISGPEDLHDLMIKYKKVKVYWEPSSKRGVHQYYALCK